MAVTLKDIASRCGASVQTVSAVLNTERAGLFRPELRRHIEQTAHELGYRPNRLARALRGGRTHTLGLLAGSVAGYTHLHHSELLGEIDRQCHSRGYHTLIGFTRQDERRLQAHLSEMLLHRVEGLVVFRSIFETFDRQIQRHLPPDLPVISLRASPEQPVGDERGDWVAVDGAAGTARLTQRAWEMGHRHFAFVTSRLRTNQAKYEGMAGALRTCGGQWDPSRTIEEATHAERAGETVEQIMALRPRPTCLLCSNDYIAVQMINQLRHMGLRVPADVSVVGYDDSWIHTMSPVPLTTIRQPRERLAELSLDALLGRIEQPEEDRQPLARLIEPELIIRDSLGQAPASIEDGT